MASDLETGLAKLDPEQFPMSAHLGKLVRWKRGMGESQFPCPPLSVNPWTDCVLELLAALTEPDHKEADGG